MKSLFMKSIYTGLGLLGNGKETVQELGRKLARKADVSEKEGEQIARHLRTRTEKAVGALQKSFDSEVHKIVSALQTATRGPAKSAKPAHRPRRRAATKHKQLSAVGEQK